MSQSLRPVRDSQRIRVYRANSSVLGTPLPSMDDISMFSHQVVTSKLWRTLFEDEKVWHVPKLKPGKGARTAHVLWHDDGRIEIAFPRAYRYSTYVLHELAHYGMGYRREVAAHGQEFVGNWLTLVREFCSGRTTNALERALHREKVKTKLPIIALPGFESLPATTSRFVGQKSKLVIDQLSLFD